MTVDIVQFKLPNGAREHITGEVSDDCIAGYMAMKDQRCRLTMEILRTGRVSSCIEHPDIGDFDCEITPNGPEVRTAVEKMLKRFEKDSFIGWFKEMTE